MPGIEHQAMVTGSGAGGVELPERKWGNTILGNVKIAMKGTYPYANAQRSGRKRLRLSV
ncbi:hypothetical protein [Thiocapsa rosea]|uniref:hypothetical protein n=1 Tax=Thiocapsa rosea TaxID=69360 RepID=UPI0014741820|nr:hypothetical protein [Thiocapsa rosea]